MQQINNRRSWFLIVVFTPTTGDVCAFARFSIFLMLGTARDKLTLRQRVTMNYCAMCFSLLLSPQTFSVIVDWHKHARPNARTATDLFDSDAITIFFLSAQIKWNVNPRVRLRSLSQLHDERQYIYFMLNSAFNWFFVRSLMPFQNDYARMKTSQLPICTKIIKLKWTKRENWRRECRRSFAFS